MVCMLRPQFMLVHRILRTNTRRSRAVELNEVGTHRNEPIRHTPINEWRQLEPSVPHQSIRCVQVDFKCSSTTRRRRRDFGEVRIAYHCCLFTPHPLHHHIQAPARPFFLFLLFRSDRLRQSSVSAHRLRKSSTVFGSPCSPTARVAMRGSHRTARFSFLLFISLFVLRVFGGGVFVSRLGLARCSRRLRVM